MEENPGLPVPLAAQNSGEAFWYKAAALLHNIVTWPATWAPLTHLAYHVTRSPLSRFLIPFYISFCAVDTEEAALPLASYRTVHELFLRDLKPGLRPVCREADSLVSPVDGCVVDCGRIEAGAVYTAKGIGYSLAGLLGDEAEAEAYREGSFLIIYMGAGDYHHVHSPCCAEVERARFLPGRHFPLYELSQRSIRGLYSRNTRQVNYLRPLRGEDAAANESAKRSDSHRHDSNIDENCFALVQIGSTLVGSIENRYDAAKASEERPRFAKAEELGRFAFGSTVILVFPPGLVELEEGLQSGRDVKMGQRIARFAKPPRLCRGALE